MKRVSLVKYIITNLDSSYRQRKSDSLESEYHGVSPSQVANCEGAKHRNTTSNVWCEVIVTDNTYHHISTIHTITIYLRSNTLSVVKQVSEQSLHHLVFAWTCLERLKERADTMLSRQLLDPVPHT